MLRDDNYVLGVDFGSDSVRVVLIRTADGALMGEAVEEYPRWKEGLYCNPGKKQFRQHPLDYMEAMTSSVRQVCQGAGVQMCQKIAAMAIDTTGSTPCPVDENGTPLALLSEFSEDPNAMFQLWKDHTAVAEAEEITKAFSEGERDYTKFQGPYSSEWFWAKILHTIRISPQIRKRAVTWVEHCDWMANLLAGTTAPERQYRCSCAAGHKAYWHRAWNGLPSENCLGKLDPYLLQVRQSFLTKPIPCGQAIGVITKEWAERLGLPDTTVISSGSFDAHAGAVGAGVCAGTMVVNIGTSAVNMMVERGENLRDSGFAYLAGQAEDSIIPGYVGIETSQSAYGDTYAWLKRLLLWPLQIFVGQSSFLSDQQRDAILKDADQNLFHILQTYAEKQSSLSGPLALDWFNGRRYPYNHDAACSTITGLTLSTDVPQLYRALVEATAFGQKRLFNNLIREGIHIDRIIAVGGIAQKSNYAMQVLSDVLQFPILVSPIAQACAYGSAIYATVAAGLYPNIEAAQSHICKPCDKEFLPDGTKRSFYQERYQQYCALSSLMDPSMPQMA